MPNRFDYAAAFARLRQEFGGKCERCPKRRHLQFAHKRPTGLMGRGRGRADRYHDIKRNRDAYMLLCYRCHLQHDLQTKYPGLAPRGRQRAEDESEVPF